jgi:hypothetical protein
MNTPYIKALIAAVGNTPVPEDEEGTDRDFANSMFACLAAALFKLPPVEREKMLQDIEGGALRPAIRKYEKPRAITSPAYQ